MLVYFPTFRFDSVLARIFSNACVSFLFNQTHRIINCRFEEFHFVILRFLEAFELKARIEMFLKINSFKNYLKSYFYILSKRVFSKIFSKSILLEC